MKPSSSYLPLQALPHYQQWLLAWGVMSSISLLSAMLDRVFLPKIGTLLFLELALVVVAAFCQRLVTIGAALYGALIFNYFFTAPRYSLHMNDIEDVLNMLVFLVIAVLTSQLASSYRRQQSALRQSELRSGILLSVSHDLRTPLASIMGALSTLQNYQQKLSVDEQNELLQSALDESHRLHRYVENLLQATKIQHGVELSTQPQLIQPLIEQVLQRFDTPRLTLTAASELPEISLRSALFEQALYNIIDNALRYSPAPLKVLVDIRTEYNHLVIDVVDQGPGIPPEAQDKVFDLFFSSRHGDAGEGGSGLGLAVAKAIIEAHRGRLMLAPSDRGCCMRITLPTLEERG